jgi:hypothetical protein
MSNIAVSSKASGCIWHGSCHALAIILTAWAIAAIPIAMALVAGVLAVIGGIIFTILLLFGADPPIMGFFTGIVFTLAAAVATVIAPALIIILAHLFTGLVVMPLILLVHRLMDRWQVRSRLMVLTFYATAGFIIGAGMGSIAYLIILLSKWQAGANFWVVAAICLACLLTGWTAVFLYQGVLLVIDAVRLLLERFVRWLGKPKKVSPDL